MWDLFGIYREIWQTKKEKITYFELGESYYQKNQRENITEVTLIKERVDNLVLRVFKDPMVEKEAAKIEVKNGTETAGLATRASRLVANLGVEVVAVESAELQNIERTLVIDYNGKSETAKRIADLFDGEVVERNPEEGRRGDIVVVMGFNYLKKL